MRVDSNTLAAAIALHDFIRSNTGENADWPIQITSSESGALERLDTLLNDLRNAIVADL